jgi:Tfp pilus assembly protein PilN
MIKINLAKMKQVKLDGGGSSSSGMFSSGGGSASVMPIVRKLGVPLALCGLIYYGYEYYIDMRQQELQADIAQIEQVRIRLQADAAKIKQYEKQKEEFERTELLFRKKVETIQKLLVQRNYAAQSLIAISRSLTPDLWLTQVSANEKTIKLKGSTIVDSQISDFMTSLDSVQYFTDLSLKGSSSAAGGSRSDFELEARRQ